MQLLRPRKAQLYTIKGRVDLQLAAEARSVRQTKRKIEHILLLLFRCRERVIKVLLQHQMAS